ncbi:MAG: hypothetical protein LBE12_02050 [Planctomycetaceae bacterium]|nr:hypothetical protein [Planctomycetaceae bacterium]
MIVESGECRKRILSRNTCKSLTTLSTIHSQLSTNKQIELLLNRYGLRIRMRNY